MTRRRWTIWLGPPHPLVAGLALLLAWSLAACHGARPTPSTAASPAGTSAASPSLASAGPAESGRPGKQPPQANELTGRTWIAEGPDGWEAGQIGGRRIALPAGEVGIAAGGRWIVSAVLRPTDSIRLLVREGPGAEPKTIELGSLAPTAIAIVGDRAYVSGFSFGDPSDPGILNVDLEASIAGVLLPPSGRAGTRYLAASPDGATLVSTRCDLASDPEPATCPLTVVSLADGRARDVGEVPGGLVRAVSSGVAVVAPHGPEASRWLAGIDLQTGAELWRVEGGEFGASFMTTAHGLIQARVTDAPSSRLVIEAIDLRTGLARIVYEESGAAVRSLWPALSSDRHIAVGDDATGSRALGSSPDGRARVSLVPIEGGEPFDVQIALRIDQ